MSVNRITMTTSSGFLFHFDREPLAKAARDRVQSTDHCTMPFSGDGWTPDRAELCLISFDGWNIELAGLATRSTMTQTGIFTLRFQHLSPIDLTPLEEEERRLLLRASVIDGVNVRPPPKTWDRILSRIRNSSDQAAQVLYDLEEYQAQQENSRNDDAFQNMAMQKDSFGLAMDMSSFDRQHLVQNERINRNPTHYAERLKNRQVNVIEEQVLAQDAAFFDNWDIRRDGTNVVRVQFQKKDSQERLSIISANRTRIEESLGVDLVYHSDRFDSFVLVQYKMMRRTNFDDFVYRPAGDPKFHEQLARMEAVNQTFRADTTPIGFSPKHYRMYPGTFFFKFCPNQAVFDPLSAELIDGIYLPLDYWREFERTEGSLGPREGQRVSWRGAERRLNNTTFTQLVRFGWIGSRHVDSGLLHERVADALAAGRTVIAADNINPSTPKKRDGDKGSSKRKRAR